VMKWRRFMSALQPPHSLPHRQIRGVLCITAKFRARRQLRVKLGKAHSEH